MASFSVEMLWKLVDQVTSPMKGVVDQVKGLENATKAATGAAATAGASAGWVQQQEAINRAREAAERHYTTVERLMNQQAQFNQIAENWARVSQIGADIGAPIEAMANRALAFEKATEALARAGDMLGDKLNLGSSALALALANQTNTAWPAIMKAREQFFAAGGTEVLSFQHLAAGRRKLPPIKLFMRTENAEVTSLPQDGMAERQYCYAELIASFSDACRRRDSDF